MNDKQIRTFINVMETQSFTATAQNMFVSQPAISHQIQSLEAELDVTLFQRTPTGILPTEAAYQFLPYAKDLDQTYRNAIYLFRGNPICSIGIPNMFIKMNRIHRLFDAIQSEQLPLEICPIPDTELANSKALLQDGKVDFLIQITENPDNEFHNIQLFSSQQQVLVSKKHPFSSRKSVAMADLEKETICMLGTDLEEHFFQKLLERGISAQKKYFTSSNLLQLNISHGKSVNISLGWTNYHADLMLIPLQDGLIYYCELSSGKLTPQKKLIFERTGSLLRE